MIAKLYRKLKSIKEASIVRLHRRKTYIMEWFVILKKRKLYKDVKWTPEQQKVFDYFWVSAYGRKISPRWHKLYQSINGVFDVEYFPDILFASKLELMMNPFQLCEQLQSKAFPELLFCNNSDVDGSNVRIPKTFALGYGGYIYDANRQLVNIINLIEDLRDIGPCIIKPAKGGSSGRGFQSLIIQSGIDVKSGKMLVNILAEYQGNFILQEKINNCAAIRSLYPHALNTIRVITYICNNQVHHCPISMRIGSGGALVDNIHAGGMVIGLSDEGVLKDKAFKLGYCDSNITYNAHPDSGIVFKGYFIPGIDQVIDTACKLHGHLPGVGIISWDFVVGDEGKPVVLETNLLGQSVWFSQIVNGCSVFGENTKSLIEYCSVRRRE